MMTHVRHCPYGHGTDIVRHGTSPEGKHRYRCRACPERGRTFLLEYAYAGQSPDVTPQMIERGRADARAQRRGLTSERDEMGSAVGKQAEPWG
jgi:transposase-like protein